MKHYGLIVIKKKCRKLLNEGIKKITGKTIPEDELKASLSRIDFTYDPLKLELLQSANNAFDVGYLGKQRPDLSGIFDTKLLDEVLKEKGLSAFRTTCKRDREELWSSPIKVSSFSHYHPETIFFMVIIFIKAEIL